MLEIDNLSVSYNGSRVLKNISLSIGKGQCLALVGESGAGKTTLGLSVMGLSEGSLTGKILFEGRDILSMTGEELRKLRGNGAAMVFQNVENALHPLYTIQEQVMEAISVHRKMEGKALRERSAGLLELVALSRDRGSKYPHQLSGGERQRAVIAMALANDPGLLILDEPTASLDAGTKWEIIKLLKKIAGDKIMLLITHDLATAAALSNFTAALYAGIIVEAGPTQEIMAAPRHPYTRGLLRSYPGMDTVKDLQGIPGKMEHDVEGCPFHPRCTQKIDACSAKMPLAELSGSRLLACHRGGIVPLIEIKGLSKNYGGARAVADAGLILYEGETLALVGESGSGKTTLARTLVGLEQPDAGEIYLEGKRLTGRNKEFHRRVQMIFQNPAQSISHRMTVLQAVKEPLDIHRSCPEKEKILRVEQALQDVELPSGGEFLNKYPHHLSGGEAQRVAIARALVLNPKIIIADEPTSALDPSVQAKIIKLLLNIQENRGLAILLITHDLALARKASDRLAVMVKGRIVEEGPTARVLSAPRHNFTRKLLEYTARPLMETHGIHLLNRGAANA